MLRRPQTPTGYTIFCDDIREEVGGKRTYVGVYSGDIIVTEPLPVTLSKLALAINLMFSPDDERHDIRLKVYGPGPDGDDIVLIDGTIPMAAADQLEAIPNVEIPMITANINAILSPFKIEREGNIRVRAYYLNQEIPLGNLVLKYDPNFSSNEPLIVPKS